VLSFPAAVKVYLCTVACDMRRSFDGLSMMAEHLIRCDPYAGHLLVFCNRRSDRLKILYWDRDGWAIWYKRLEAGTFQFPFAETGARRSRPGSWPCCWRGLICSRVGDASVIAGHQWRARKWRVRSRPSKHSGLRRRACFWWCRRILLWTKTDN